jgi:hypothetical protein
LFLAHARFLKERILGAETVTARNFKVVESAVGGDTAARGAIEEAELNQIRLVDFLNRVRLFIDGS